MIEITIDVCLLPPPEPMQQILLALSTLSPKQYLKVVHRRQPVPLFEKLADAGWGYHCVQVSEIASEDLFHIYIYQLTEKSLFISTTNFLNINKEDKE